MVIKTASDLYKEKYSKDINECINRIKNLNFEYDMILELYHPDQYQTRKSSYKPKRPEDWL